MRTKTSVILKAARRHLPTHQKKGICLAIHNSNAGSREDRLRVCEMISKRIYPFSYASDWLAWTIVHGPKKRDQRKTQLNEWIAAYEWLDDQERPAIQTWRYQWLDQMIAEFEKKGD